MEEIKVNHSVWKMLLRAIACFTVVALFVRLNGGFNLSDYGSVGLFFFFGFGMLGLYFLFVLIIERLLGQPFMTISSNGLVVNRLFRKKKVINFSDVKSFDNRDVLYGLGPIVLDIHFNKGKDRVKDSIHISSIDKNAIKLCVYLDEIKKMSRQSSQFSIENQRYIQKNYIWYWRQIKICFPTRRIMIPRLSDYLSISSFSLSMYLSVLILLIN